VDALEASVVIPASRERRLAAALAALAGQTVSGERFEVVVVRDPAAAVEVDAPQGLAVRVIDGATGGNIASLRNAGWRAARGRVVAFTDDDCRPAPGWLEALAGAVDGADGFAQGRTEPDPDEAVLLYGLARSQTITGPSPWFETCNMAYPRALIEALGGFDERFVALGEDADLALRAVASGARRTYVAEALTWHAVLPRTLGVALREAWRRNTIPLLIALRPQQREALYGGIFWKRSHALILLAAAGLVAARRRPPAALAVVPWVLSNTQAESVRGHPKRIVRHAMHLAAFACVDAVEVAATAVSAARWRTLVL
jgi:glycosyltransferase involved in cell wall biosynthesis